MNHFSTAFNSQPNLHHVHNDVGVGLLSEIKINMFNTIPIKNLRPTLGANQHPTTYVQNTFTSMVAKRVGLKYRANYFVNKIHFFGSARPTPTLIKRNGILFYEPFGY
jgi:hypothetical protein